MHGGRRNIGGEEGECTVDVVTSEGEEGECTVDVVTSEGEEGGRRHLFDLQMHLTWLESSPPHDISHAYLQSIFF